MTAAYFDKVVSAFHSFSPEGQTLDGFIMDIEAHDTMTPQAEAAFFNAVAASLSRWLISMHTRIKTPVYRL